MRINQPVHMGTFCINLRSRANRSRARRSQSLRPDLDHHALDHPGQRRHRLSIRSSNTSQSKWATPFISSPSNCCGSRRKSSAGTSPKVLAAFPGAKLEGAVFRHPFIERDSLGILGEHVTLEQGTGAVHTAPGHGQEDFEVGTKYGLPMYCPVDPRRPFLSGRRRRGASPERSSAKPSGRPIPSSTKS